MDSKTYNKITIITRNGNTQIYKKATYNKNQKYKLNTEMMQIIHKISIIPQIYISYSNNTRKYTRKKTQLPKISQYKIHKNTNIRIL